MKFGADIHYPQMMYPQDFGEYTSHSCRRQQVEMCYFQKDIQSNARITSSSF